MNCDRKLTSVITIGKLSAAYEKSNVILSIDDYANLSGSGLTIEILPDMQNAFANTILTKTRYDVVYIRQSERHKFQMSNFHIILHPIPTLVKFSYFIWSTFGTILIDEVELARRLIRRIPRQNSRRSTWNDDDDFTTTDTHHNHNKKTCIAHAVKER